MQFDEHFGYDATLMIFITLKLTRDSNLQEKAPHLGR